MLAMFLCVRLACISSDFGRIVSSLQTFHTSGHVAELVKS